LSAPHLPPDLARSIGRAAVTVIARDRREPPTFVIGRDTRASGPLLEDALVDGIVAGGGNAIRAGVVPTPAVAYLTTELGVESGVVISASHNPPEDNGIKFFGFRGFKLSDRLEDEIEAEISAGGGEGVPAGRELPMPSGGSGYPHPVGRRRPPPPPPRLPPRRPRTPGRRGDRDPRRAGRLEHQRRLRRALPRGGRGSGRRPRPPRRGRARRRRRPRAVRRRRRERDRRRPGARGLRDLYAGGRHAHRRHGRRDRDVEPRVPPGEGGPG